METTAQFEVYKDILVKMEIIELPETLKMAGVHSEGLPNFQNIGVYHEKYKPLMEDKHTPYTEVGVSFCNSERGLYIFGCQVDSIDGLPEGLCGLDTGMSKFACLTFRVQPGGDLVGGADGPGDGMNLANEYLLNEWVPKNKEKVYNNFHAAMFRINQSEKPFRILNIPMEDVETYYNLSYWIEVYKVNISDDPEMCYYIPLK